MGNAGVGVKVVRIFNPDVKGDIKVTVGVVVKIEVTRTPGVGDGIEITRIYHAGIGDVIQASRLPVEGVKVGIQVAKAFDAGVRAVLRIERISDVGFEPTGLLTLAVGLESERFFSCKNLPEY